MTEKGYCPICNTKMVFAESVLDMWCPKCRDYLNYLKLKKRFLVKKENMSEKTMIGITCPNCDKKLLITTNNHKVDRIIMEKEK